MLDLKMSDEELKTILQQLLFEGIIEEKGNGWFLTEKGTKKWREEESTFLTTEELIMGQWSYSCIHLATSPFLEAIPMEREEGWTGDMLCEWCAERDIHELLDAHLIVIFTDDDLEKSESDFAG